jgi:hypothetical protein
VTHELHYDGRTRAEHHLPEHLVHRQAGGDLTQPLVAPAVIPPGSKYWFEVVTGDKKELGSIDFKK